MIVTCPACRTRYLVDDRALAEPAGRTVRCANCGHTWQQQPEQAMLMAAGAAEPAPGEQARIEPPIDVPPRPAAAPMPPARRRGGGGFGVFWVLLLVVIAAAAIAFIVGRQQIVARWPQTRPAYAFIGLSVTTPGRGLEIRRIHPTRSGGGLVIQGEVANTGNAAQSVPRLRVVLRDASDRPVETKTIAPPRRRLSPGQVEHFRATFQRPNEAATGVVVTFSSS